MRLSVLGKRWLCIGLGGLVALAVALPSQVWAKKARDKADTNEQLLAADADASVKKKRKKKRKQARVETLAESDITGKGLGGVEKTKNKPKINSVSDQELASIYTNITAGKSAAALSQIEVALAKAPNHKLLHLLHADLLLILSQGKRGVSAALAKLNPAQQDQLNILQQEAWLRLNSHANRVKASASHLVPKPLLKLADNEPYALVVDSKLSRLYVYQNIPNGAPKLINDYYVTQGQQGALKLKEGDNRTPVGAYFIDRPIDQKLPDLYGYGALNMDYPNAWDKNLGRTGYGIWLHGTPSSTYARAPYASNGCVVLANPDVEAIFKLARAGAMPIVIVDKLDWVEASSLEAMRKQITLAITERVAIETASASKMTNLAVIEYPSEAGLLLTRFHLVKANQQTIKKEQYWKKEAGQWKMLLDNTL